MLGYTITLGLLFQLCLHQSGSIFAGKPLQQSTVTNHGVFGTSQRTLPWLPQVASPFPQRRHQRRRELVSSMQSPQTSENPCPKACSCLNKVVRCEGSEITEFPKNLPKDTERM